MIASNKPSDKDGEWKWRATSCKSDQIDFKSKQNYTTYLMNTVRRDFYTSFVKENSSDQGKLFRATKTLLKQTTRVPFIPGRDSHDLPNDMGWFFTKIVDIHAELTTCESTATGEDSTAIPAKVPDHQFTAFDYLSDVRALGGL